MDAKWRNIIKGLVLVGILLFLALPTISGSIDIIDMGIGYDCVDHYGHIDYQPNSNSTGILSVFIDDSLVKTKALDMKIRYIVGFRCNPVKTREFTLNETEGNHTIVALIISDNITVQSTISYYAEEWWTQEAEDDEEETYEVSRDWLTCWRYER